MRRARLELTATWIVLPVVLWTGVAGGVVATAETEREPVRAPASRVPAWDARGSGLLPKQGISCIAINDDASRIVVGTIAPPGDPNVIVVDASGNVLRMHSAGQRWINQVALATAQRADSTAVPSLPDETVFALSTMPEGRAGDFCTAFACGRDVAALPGRLGQDDFVQNLFHYGDHSNHCGVQLKSSSTGAVALFANRVQWFRGDGAAPYAAAAFPRPQDAVTVSLAVSRSGHALAGCTALVVDGFVLEHNLFLLSPQSKEPVWSRPAPRELDDGPAPEKGQYGTPTLPDGTRNELPQSDVRVSVPLSAALFGEPEPQRIAVADYPGWQRWIRSSATRRDQNYGLRCLHARPAITVYDSAGKVLRTFKPEQFAEACWLDLQFLPGGKQLVAWPHHWTCRGLAGQTILPADDEARTVYRLDVDTGAVLPLGFPDAISSLAVSESGRIVAGCWNGRVYRLDADAWKAQRLLLESAEGIDLGGPSLVAVNRDGTRAVAATTQGVIHLFDERGRSLWKNDLNQSIPRAKQPSVAEPQAEQIGPGVWQVPRGRFESDFGGQRLIEAPQGLILIEGHAGLSFEREWEAIKAAGLDPKRVKYVLATHEHGDHAPGAYLWRVATGAQFVCSAEMAYTLQHHIPIGTGYGFHPPVPADIRVTQDTDLDLAGLKVRAVRLPGHTYGSMGWLFRKGDQSYVATGDLIMPDGVLGYAESINFSATDVLASLRKLAALRAGVVLPGHGPWGNPDRYIAAGISVGRHVGWGKMPPEEPDQFFRLTQKNVLVTAWNIDAASADFGDVNGDQRPDVAIVAPAPAGEGSVIKLFLNKTGRFDARPDHEIIVPQVSACGKIRLRQINDDSLADFVIGGTKSAVVTSRGRWPEYDVEILEADNLNQVRAADIDGDGQRELLVDRRFGSFEIARRKAERGWQLTPLTPEVRGPYADVQVLNLNGDQQADLISSYGQVFLRPAGGQWPAQPSQTLGLPQPNDWCFLAVGDFNGDRKPDAVLMSYGMQQTSGSVWYNRGDAARPFGDRPDTVLDLREQGVPANRQPAGLLRDSPPVADWNGDGFDDLIVGKGQDNKVLVLHGGKSGLSPSQSTTVALDYRLHYETGLFVADFNGDGRADLASLGYTNTGVGAGGPLAVYVWLQPPAGNAK